MKKITKKTLAIILISISFWITGSFLLYPEKNGKTTIMIISIIIMGGLYSQIKKDKKVYS